MLGLAGKLFQEKQKELFFELPPPRFPLLWSHVQKGDISMVDYAYAEKAENEEQAALLCAVMASAREGHLRFNLEDPIDFVELVKRGAKSYSGSSLVQSGDNFYLKRNWAYETQFIEQLERLRRAPVREVPLPTLASELTEEQREAIARALKHPISLIIGGPGTGKTFTALHLATAFLETTKRKRLILTAPTGKAAAHLDKNFELDAEVRCGTLHSLLRKESLSADLIIVDECSMIDVRLFVTLLSSIPEGAHLVLMGDPDQLPPVETGSFFVDLVEAVKQGYPLAQTELTRCLRSDRAEILNLSWALKTNDEKKLLEGLSFIDLGLDSPRFYPALWEHVKEEFSFLHKMADPHELFEQLDQFCILCSLRQGPFGVDSINEFLYQKIKGSALPILILQNDYEKELYNGEIGLLIGQEAFFRGREGALRQFKASLLPAFDYAFALSVHKSQGSEFERILLLIPEGSEIFGREGLYTALTRAKTSLQVDGQEKIILEAIKKTSRKKSGVCERLFEEGVPI